MYVDVSGRTNESNRMIEIVGTHINFTAPNGESFDFYVGSVQTADIIRAAIADMLNKHTVTVGMEKEQYVQKLEHMLLQAKLEQQPARSFKEEVYLRLLDKVTAEDLDGQVQDVGETLAEATKIMIEEWEKI